MGPVPQEVVDSFDQRKKMSYNLNSRCKREKPEQKTKRGENEQNIGDVAEWSKAPHC